MSANPSDATVADSDLTDSTAAPASLGQDAPGTPWWAGAVIYQIYPRSFADSNGDGMGDLGGVIAHLDYLRDLGIDAVWLSPFYRSPQNDAGYDVADYREIDPMFGTMSDAEDLITQAHARGIRVIVDLVPNHTSDQHEWFQEALASPPGSASRARYHFEPGKGEAGELPPNNWQSVFGGRAWTRTTDANGNPGEWYLHLFDTSQPDLNWNNDEVHAEFREILHFWLDRGVDGFRVDVAHGLVKAPGLPDHSGVVHMVSGDDEAAAGEQDGASEGGNHDPMASAPYFDQEGVHEIYREWNEVLKQYDGDRMLVAEAWVEPVSRLFRYVRPGEMQQAFTFGFLVAGYDAVALDGAVRETIHEAANVGAPATWVLSNHDTVRHASRFGLAEVPPMQHGIGAHEAQPDVELGRRRARVAAMIELALPGSAYIYQGDELALPDHSTLEDSLRQDPTFFRTHGADFGRDGARIPMPWDSTQPALGFSGGAGDDTDPWLPQPDCYAEFAADVEAGDGNSVLCLYQTLLKLRRTRGLGHASLSEGELHAPTSGILHWILTGKAGATEVIANLSSTSIDLNERKTLVVSRAEAIDSEGLDSASPQWTLAGDSAIWAAR